jgi:ubiquinone/menaquinone biosynthesis C-methylase UbiE
VHLRRWPGRRSTGAAATDVEEPRVAGPKHTNPLFASAYDTIMRPLEALGVRDQRRRIGEAARGRVLEIGAGTGAMLAHYTPTVTEVVATEVDPRMLERAGAKADHARVPVVLREADAQQLPFDDATFDTVVVTLSLCTIPDPQAALREARRVLRRDGQLLFVEHVRSLRPGVGRLQDAVTPVWRRVASGCHLNRDTVGVIERSGFRVEHLWRSGGRRGSMVQGRAEPR